MKDEAQVIFDLAIQEQENAFAAGYCYRTKIADYGCEVHYYKEMGQWWGDLVYPSTSVGHIEFKLGPFAHSWKVVDLAYDKALIHSAIIGIDEHGDPIFDEDILMGR